MKTIKLPNFLKSLLPLLALLIVPATTTAIAQSTTGGSGSSTTQTQSAPSSSSSTRETTTTTTQTVPVKEVTRIDPMWLVIGGAAVLALIIIAILATRG